MKKASLESKNQSWSWGQEPKKSAKIQSGARSLFALCARATNTTIIANFKAMQLHRTMLKYLIEGSKLIVLILIFCLIPFFLFNSVEAVRH